jgi:hypothetical protein
MKSLTIKEYQRLMKWLHDKCDTLNNPEDGKNYMRLNEVFFRNAPIVIGLRAEEIGIALAQTPRNTKVKVRLDQDYYDVEFISEETRDGNQVVVLNIIEE